MPGIDAQQARHFAAGHVDQHGVAVGRIEPQTLRRVGADVALRADRRENRVLDLLEVGMHRRHNRNRLTVLVESFAISGASSRQAINARHDSKNPFAARKLVLIHGHADTPRVHARRALVTRRWHAVPRRAKNPCAYSARLSRRIVSKRLQGFHMSHPRVANSSLRSAALAAAPLLAGVAGKAFAAGAGAQARRGVVRSRESLHQPDRAGACRRPATAGWRASSPARPRRPRNGRRSTASRTRASMTTRPCIAWPTTRTSTSSTW